MALECKPRESPIYKEWIAHYSLPAQFVAHLKRMSPIDSIAMEEPSNVICRS
jgi:hypothetical protein